MRNSSALNLDETYNYGGINFVALLQEKSKPGQIAPDQQLIIDLLSSPEYLRVFGDTNAGWVLSVYTKILGQTTVDTSPGLAYSTTLNAALTTPAYQAARQAAAVTLVGTTEFRNRLFTNYSTQYLDATPTAAQLSALETTFATTANHTYEGVLASILSSSNYYPLSGPGSLNSTWLSNIYDALLSESTNNNTTAANQLTYLNSQSPPNPGETTATVQAARNTVALQVLTSTAYRQDLVTQLYDTYLDRDPTSAELTTWVNASERRHSVPAEHHLHPVRECRVLPRSRLISAERRGPAQMSGASVVGSGAPKCATPPRGCTIAVRLRPRRTGSLFCAPAPESNAAERPGAVVRREPVGVPRARGGFAIRRRADR